MKAVIATTYGSPEVLQIIDVVKPEISDNEVLVLVKAVAVTAADARIRAAHFPKGFGVLARLAFGLRKPRQPILGSTFSGVVEKVGKNVTSLKPGDQVCGMTGVKMGTYAEFIKINVNKSIVKKPSTINHEDAAGMLFGGTAALYFLRDVLKLMPDETIVVNGASGAVGTNAVQLATYFGANVTGVTSGNNTALVKELGAGDVVDYTQQDLVSSGKKFDVVLDTVGNISPEAAKTLLTQKGRAGLMVANLQEMMRTRGNVKSGTATEKPADIAFLLSLMEQGMLKTVIDSTYSLTDIVAAHKHADGGQKTGNIIIKFN